VGGRSGDRERSAHILFSRRINEGEFGMSGVWIHPRESRRLPLLNEKVDHSRVASRNGCMQRGPAGLRIVRGGSRRTAYIIVGACGWRDGEG